MLTEVTKSRSSPGAVALQSAPAIKPLTPSQVKVDDIAKSLIASSIPEVKGELSDVNSLYSSVVSYLEPKLDTLIGSSINSITMKVTCSVASAIQVLRGKQAIKDGYKIRDSTQVASGALRITRAAGDFLTNGTGIAANGISLASKAENLKKVMSSLTIASTVGVGVTSLAIGTIFLLDTYEKVAAAKKFSKQETVEKKIAFLESFCKIKDEEIDQLADELFTPLNTKKQSLLSSYIDKIFGDPKIKEEEKKLKEALKDLTPDAKNTLLEDIKKSLKAGEDLDLSGLDDNIKIPLEFLLKEHLDELKKKKETIFERVFSKEAKEALSDVKLGKISPAQVIKTVDEHVKKSLIINALIMLGSVLTMAGVVMAEISAAGALFLAELAIGIVSTLMFFVVDTYYLLQEFEKDHSFKDKMVMIGMTLLVTVSNVVSLVLAKSLVSTAKIALPAAFLGLWLVSMLYGIYTAKAKKPEVKDTGYHFVPSQNHWSQDDPLLTPVVS